MCNVPLTRPGVDPLSPLYYQLIQITPYTLEGYVNSELNILGVSTRAGLDPVSSIVSNYFVYLITPRSKANSHLIYHVRLHRVNIYNWT